MNPRTTWKNNPHRFAIANFLLVVALFSSLLVAAASTPASAATSRTDNFDRANGVLGRELDHDDRRRHGDLVARRRRNRHCGVLRVIRTGETYAANQTSQIQITAPQLATHQLIGVAARAERRKQPLPRCVHAEPPQTVARACTSASTATGLNSARTRAVLSRAGTTLQLSVSDFNLTLSQNGVKRIKVKDTSFTGGAPGIMALGTPRARQLAGRWEHHEAAGLLGRRHRERPVGHARVAEQRRRRPHGDRERRLHVRDAGCLTAPAMPSR